MFLQKEVFFDQILGGSNTSWLPKEYSGLSKCPECCTKLCGKQPIWFSPSCLLSLQLTVHTLHFRTVSVGTLAHHRIPCEEGQLSWCGTMDKQHSHTTGMTGSHSVLSLLRQQARLEADQKMNTYLFISRLRSKEPSNSLLLLLYLYLKSIVEQEQRLWIFP